MGVFGEKFNGFERSLPVRLAKVVFGSGFWAPRWAESGIFKNQGVTVTERDFGCLPCRALIKPVGPAGVWISGTIEPVEVRFVVGDPFPDRQPRRLDGLHGLDVEGRRWRAWQLNQPLPQPVEAEEEYDLLPADDLADRFHGAPAAWALERVAAPDSEDQVVPKSAHVVGGLLRRCGDEEDFRLMNPEP